MHLNVVNDVPEGVMRWIIVIESPYCARNNCSHTGARPTGAFCCLLARTKYIFCILNGIPRERVRASSSPRMGINSFLSQALRHVKDGYGQHVW